VDIQPRVLRDSPRKMVVEITDPHPAFQQPEKGVPIPVQGDIENRYLIAGVCLNPCQQPDVALDARDQGRLPRRDQAELLECADAIRISVEDVEIGHVLFPISLIVTTILSCISNVTYGKTRKIEPGTELETV